MARTIEDSVLFAEFASPEALIGAIAVARKLGCAAMEAYTPYPLQAVEEALVLPRSRLPRLILAAGLTGAVSAYTLQTYLAAVDYPLNVAGMPYHSGPAFIPIVFETTILFAALASFFGFLATVRLPRLWHHVFEIEGFETATVTRFWLELRGEGFDIKQTQAALRDAGALRVEQVGGVAT